MRNWYNQNTTPVYLLIASIILFAPSTAAQDLVLEGRWETSWGTTNIVRTPTGYEGTYEQDNGRFYFTSLADGTQIGHWGEDAASVECDFYSPRLQSYFTGIVYWDGAASEAPFTVNWSYCNGNPYPGEWVFLGRLESATVEALIAKLELERQAVGAISAGGRPYQFTEAHAIGLRDDLMALGVPETDWPHLVEAHFGQDAVFDANVWDSFAEFVRRSHVSNAQRRAAANFGENLRSAYGVPDEAIVYLEGQFFLSESLRNLDVSGPYNDDYVNYVLQTIGNSADPLLNELLGDSRQALQAVLNPTAPAKPTPVFTLPPQKL